MKEPFIYFFDVDHTITRRSTGLHFAIRAAKAGYIHIGALLSVPLFYIKYRLGGITEEDLGREFNSLKGVPKEELEKLGERTFLESIMKDIYPEARELIQSLQQKGAEVVIATSSIDLVIRPLARYLGVKTVLAGSLEYSGGKCTGRFKGKLYFGENKLKETLEFLAGRNIKPEDCAFYSDSIHDLPLLEKVGTPVAVNPDIRLRKLAGKRGWKIIRFR